MTSRVCWLLAASGAVAVEQSLLLLFMSMTSAFLASSFVMSTLVSACVISYVVVERQHSVTALRKRLRRRSFTLVWPVNVVVVLTVVHNGRKMSAYIEVLLPGHLWRNTEHSIAAMTAGMARNSTHHHLQQLRADIQWCEFEQKCGKPTFDYTSWPNLVKRTSKCTKCSERVSKYSEPYLSYL